VPSIFVTALTVLAGLGLGAGALLLWQRHVSSQALRLPYKWPLRSRVMLTTEEAQAFEWLRGIFPDHFVMCKLPVLRFTVPVKKEQKSMARRWQELLHGVYCTFTVCTKDGAVIGCVDVHGKRGLTTISRELKERLLEDCAVAYITVRSAALPNAGVVRSAFLGEMKQKSTAEQNTRGGDSDFNAELVHFTDEKRQAALRELKKKDSKPVPLEPEGFDPDGTGAFAARRPGRGRVVYDDSFVSPIDTRPARLR
jgi:Protein of unknown function (DUF2726)